MDRRKFLKLVGGGSVLAAVGGATGLALTRTPTKALAPWQIAGSAEYTDPRLRALSFAILAPNPHNRQPWIADIGEPDVVTLFFDTDRTLPETDPFDRQLTVGMGCFLELLEMAANAEGYRIETAMFPQGGHIEKLGSEPIARIRFVADGNVQVDPLFAHVLDRRSMKEAHDMSRQVPQAELDKVMAAAKNNTIVGSTSREADLTYWRDLTEKAMSLEMDTPATHKESVDLFRIGKTEINANPDGIELPGLSMELMAMTGLLTREATLDTKSTAFNEGKKAVIAPMRTSMGYMWMTTPGNARDQQINAGRDWVRMNLAATAQGLGFHPNSQALQEYPEMKPLYDEVHAKLAPNGETVQMLVRIGYGEKVGPTPRWPLESRLRNA